MKIKAKSKNGVVVVKMLLKHDMETGRRKDKNGNVIPAHHITEVAAHYKGEQVYQAQLGTAISKNPYLAFSFKGDSGEVIKIDWADTKGATQSGESVIK